mmetsp:Transcript_53488/g.88858  ORF Transcript_53488/g.88858 Transcript_53488/m.88858 type:complete len:343 (-) Transcript_53488:117-1145(-)
MRDEELERGKEKRGLQMREGKESEFLLLCYLFEQRRIEKMWKGMLGQSMEERVGEGEGEGGMCEGRKVRSAVLGMTEGAAGDTDRADVHVLTDGDQGISNVVSGVPDKQLARRGLDDTLAIDLIHVDLLDLGEVHLAGSVDAGHRDLGEHEAHLWRLDGVLFWDDDFEVVDQLADRRLLRADDHGVPEGEFLELSVAGRLADTVADHAGVDVRDESLAVLSDRGVILFQELDTLGHNDLVDVLHVLLESAVAVDDLLGSGDGTALGFARVLQIQVAHETGELLVVFVELCLSDAKWAGDDADGALLDEELGAAQTKVVSTRKGDRLCEGVDADGAHVAFLRS